MRFLLAAIAAIVVCAIGLFLGSENPLYNEFVGGGSILLICLVFVDGLTFIITNRKRIKLIFQCIWLRFRKQYVRFSMSYQYLIKVNDKYLLVQNANKSWNWYQHVGGKYKRLSETQLILQKFDARDDIKMKTDNLKKGDLAVFIPAKNAIKFLDWFDTRTDREISHWREFYEELIGGKAQHQVLSTTNFPYVNYRLLKSVRTPLKKAPAESGWNCWEMLHYDVLELIPTIEQETELLTLLAQGDTDYIKWADEQLINNLGHDDRQKEKIYDIGVHTKWAMNLKWSKS